MRALLASASVHASSSHRRRDTNALRVGVVGGGAIVENSHLPALTAAQDLDVRWLIDPDARRRDLLSRMYGVAAARPDQLSARIEEVDALLVATPLGARAPYLEAAADRGLAVLCEKPFATTTADHERWIARFGEPWRLGIGLQRRAFANVRLAERAVQARIFGNVMRARVFAGGYDLKSGGAGRYLTDPKMGGGVLVDLGVHAVDQALVVVGAEDASVTDAQAVCFDGLDFEVRFLGEAKAGGRAIAIEGHVTRLRPIHQRVEIQCERATLWFPPTPDAPVRVHPTDGGAPFALAPEPGDGAFSVGESFALEWRAFVEQVRTEKPSWVAGASSLATTRVLDGVYRRLRG